MVDAGAFVGNVIDISSNPFCQHLRRSLHAVAKARRPHAEMQKVARHHAHGIAVIEDKRLRTELDDIPCDGGKRRRAAQETENAGGSPRVADHDIDAVFFRDRKVFFPHGDRRVIADGDQHRIRPLERGPAVQRRLHGRRISALNNDFSYDFFSGIHVSLSRRNVDQHDTGVRKCGIG